MNKLNRVQAIKGYFERADEIAPEGGRKVTLQELSALTGDERLALAKLCVERLGVELDEPKN